MLVGSEPSDVSVDSSSNVNGPNAFSSQGWTPSDADNNPTLIFTLKDKDGVSEISSISFDEDNVESVTIIIRKDAVLISEITVRSLS